jgi:hypothetical protein
MPAVIIKMLAASELGKIQLLPALPAAWSSGRIEGVLCRGAIEIQSLEWDGKEIQVVLQSAKAQSIVLELPSEITQLSIAGGTAKAGPADRANQRTLAVPSGQPVSLVIQRK